MVIPEFEHFQIPDLFVMSLVFMSLGTRNSMLMTNFRIVKVWFFCDVTGPLNNLN